MDDATKAFLDKCTQSNESLNKSWIDTNNESCNIPSMTKLDVEEIFAVGGESTTVSAIQIGVSAVSA